MKRIISVIVCACLLLPSVACAGDGNDGDQQAPSSSVSETVAPDTAPWYEKIIKASTQEIALQVCENNGRFFYATDSGINCYDPLTAQESIVIKDIVHGLLFYDGVLYYNNDKQVKRYDPETKATTLLWDMDTSARGLGFAFEPYVCDFWLHGGYLYIKDSSMSALRIDLETNEAERFLEDVSECVFSDTHCYYIEHAQKSFSVYSVELETLEQKLVAGQGVSRPQDIIISKVYMLDGELYYYERVSERIYKYQKDSEDIAVTSNRFELIKWNNNGFICYDTADESEHKIYRLEASGDTQLLLTEPLSRHNGSHIVTESAVFCVPYWNSEDKVSVTFIQPKAYEEAVAAVSKYANSGNSLSGSLSTETVNGREYYIIKEFEDHDTHTATVEWYAVDAVTKKVYVLDINQNTLLEPNTPIHYREVLGEWYYLSRGFKDGSFVEKAEGGSLYYPTNDETLKYNWSCMCADAVVPEGDTTDFGYVLKDINGDRTDELFLVDSDRTVLALFTVKDKAAVLLEAFWPKHAGYVGDSGEIVTHTFTGAGSVYSVLRFGSDSALETVLELREQEGKYYKTENGVKTEMTSAEFNGLSAKYPDRNGEDWLNTTINLFPNAEQ